MGKSQNAQRKTRRSNFNVRDAPPLCSPSTGSTLVFHKSDPCSRFLVHSCIDVHVRSLLIYDTNMRTLDGRFDDLIFVFRSRHYSKLFSTSAASSPSIAAKLRKAFYSGSDLVYISAHLYSPVDDRQPRKTLACPKSYCRRPFRTNSGLGRYHSSKHHPLAPRSYRGSCPTVAIAPCWPLRG